MSLYFISYEGDVQGFPIIAKDKKEAEKKFKKYLKTRVDSVKPTLKDIKKKIQALDKIVSMYEKSKNTIAKEQLEKTKETAEQAKLQKEYLIEGESGLNYYQNIYDFFNNIDLKKCVYYRVEEVEA